MRLLKQILIILAGTIVLLIGTAMIILPGPAVIVIPAGLAILGVEFEWARRCLQKLRNALPARFQKAWPANTTPATSETKPPAHGQGALLKTFN